MIKRRPVRPHPRLRERYRRSTSCRRRRAVPGGKEGTQTEFPHLQRAVTRAEADRPQQRLPAARDSVARRASAIALRMGADCRHSAPDLENKIAFSSEKPRAKGSACPTDRDLHRGQEKRTSASSRGRSSAAGLCVADGKDITLQLAKDVLRNILVRTTRRCRSRASAVVATITS